MVVKIILKSGLHSAGPVPLGGLSSRRNSRVHQSPSRNVWPDCWNKFNGKNYNDLPEAEAEASR